MPLDLGQDHRFRPPRQSGDQHNLGVPVIAALVGVAFCGILASAFLTGATGKKSIRPFAKALDYTPRVKRSVTIDRPADELFKLWDDPENFRLIIGHFADVEPADDERSNWSAPAPLGQWQMKKVESKPGRRLRWEGVEGRAALQEMAIEFRPERGNRGTVVTIDLRIDPPGGLIGQAATRIMHNVVPGEIASKTLHYFKSLVLTAEIPTTDRQPARRDDTR